MQMINETMLFKHIQKPFELGVKARKILQAKFQVVKQQVETFLDESDSIVDACQEIGERVGRFVGQGVGLVCTYSILPGAAVFILITLRLSKRIQARWLTVKTWVNESAPTQEASNAAMALNDTELNAEPAPTFTEDEKVLTMVALPPCDQPSTPFSWEKSIAFIQETAAELPKSFTEEGIKQAYQKAKRRTQHNHILAGLVTAGFTALSFFTIQINQAKETAIASHTPEALIEEVTQLNPTEDLDLDSDNQDLDPDSLDYGTYDMN